MVRLLKRWNPRKLSFIAAALCVGPITAAAHGATATITDGNSSLTFNQGVSTTNPLVTSWIVDGTNQYGGSPAGSEMLSLAVGSGASQSILALTQTSSFASDGLYSATFTGSGFDVTVKDVLSGGAANSGASAINEIITINNLSLDTPTTFHLIQTLDYNVNATPANDTLTLSPSNAPNTADQTDPLGAHINVSVIPTPDSYTLHNGGINTTNVGPFTGNEAFTFEWNPTIADGGSAQFSVNQTLTGGEVAGGATVPLPAASLNAAAMLAGLGTIAIVRRTRKPLIA